MSEERFTDDMLVAFADHELDAETSARIEAALETDSALAARLEAFVATRQILKARLGPLEREPVPDHLTRFVLSGGAPGTAGSASPPARGEPASASRRWAAWPLAASIAAVMAGTAGYLVGGAGRDIGSGGPVAALAAAEPALVRAFGRSADGEKLAWRAEKIGRSGELSLKASYKTRAGYCRSFTVVDSAQPAVAIAGVACRDGQDWRMRVMATESVATGAVFTPASGGAKAVDAFLESVEADDPLAGEQVRDLIGRDWR